MYESTYNRFCHAIQSFFWNELASYRVEKYGMKLQEFDLVEDSITVSETVK